MAETLSGMRLRFQKKCGSAPMLAWPPETNNITAAVNQSSSAMPRGLRTGRRPGRTWALADVADAIGQIGDWDDQ